MTNVNVSNATEPRGSRAKREPDYSVETVTPAIAHEWLGLNTHNRKASKQTVDRYARDMEKGLWEFTADPVRFNGVGTLIDGQHRLLACIKADRPFLTLVVRNLPITVQERLDQGKNRSAYDHLMLRGIEGASRVASTARALIALKNNHPSWQNGMRPTNSEILQMYEKHTNIAESALAAHGVHVGSQPSLIGAVHFVASNILGERDLADQFVGVFVTGVPTYEGDAAHLWRERLIAQQEKGAHLRRTSKYIGTIHAWNLFRRREPLKIFRLPDSAVIDGLDPDLI